MELYQTLKVAKLWYTRRPIGSTFVMGRGDCYNKEGPFSRHRYYSYPLAAGRRENPTYYVIPTCHNAKTFGIQSTKIERIMGSYNMMTYPQLIGGLMSSNYHRTAQRL